MKRVGVQKSKRGNELLIFHIEFLSKTCLRHPDCESARINKDAVFQRMRCALEQVIEIVTEARSCGENKMLPASIYNGIKDFKVGSGTGFSIRGICEVQK